MTKLLILIVTYVTCFGFQAQAQLELRPENVLDTSAKQEFKKVFENRNEMKYLEMLPDVPLIEGLEELPDTGIIFDKPDGRIAESFFYSEQVSAQDVDYFYMQTLPQLGWNLTETPSIPSVYIREGEQLTVKTTQSEEAVVVHFSLSPQQKK